MRRYAAQAGGGIPGGRQRSGRNGVWYFRRDDIERWWAGWIHGYDEACQYGGFTISKCLLSGKRTAEEAAELYRAQVETDVQIKQRSKAYRETICALFRSGPGLSEAGKMVNPMNTDIRGPVSILEFRRTVCRDAKESSGTFFVKGYRICRRVCIRLKLRKECKDMTTSSCCRSCGSTLSFIFLLSGQAADNCPYGLAMASLTMRFSRPSI